MDAMRDDFDDEFEDQRNEKLLDLDDMLDSSDRDRMHMIDEDEEEEDEDDFDKEDEDDDDEEDDDYEYSDPPIED